MHLHAQQKIYFHVMQAQGGPSRAELWDKGQRSTPDSHLCLKTPVQTCSRPPKQNKSHPDAVYSRKHFSLRNKRLVEFQFFSLLVLVGGEEMRSLWQKKKKWERKPTFEMYTFPKKEKKNPLQYTVYPIAHWSCQRVEVFVFTKTLIRSALYRER